ncbi:MAG: SU10 major capsid protein [Sulfuricaulis sp.]
MALQAAGGFATFNITDGAQIRDISPLLSDAIYYDLHLLGNLNVDFANPATDTTHYWNEDILNTLTFTMSAVATGAGSTSLTGTSGQGGNAHVGDLLIPQATATQPSTEIYQVTAIATDVLTVTPSYGSSVAQSLVASSVFNIIPSEQEGSDISGDKSNSPTVRNNYTHILAGKFDVKITGSQLARQMATAQMQDFVARQLSNRAIELKIGLSLAALYSELSGSSGSATAYRTMKGIRAWIRDQSGVTDSTTTAFSYTNINSYNKTVVNKGVFPDTLVIGTDLVGSVTGYDSGNRRFQENDRVPGYTVQQVLLNQGNMVNVVVDPRVNVGDAFLLSSERIKLVPLQGRGMFVIAAVDFTDAKKRRVGAEWTLEMRQPQAHAWISNKT